MHPLRDVTPPPANPRGDDLLEHLDWVRRLARSLVRDANVADDLVQDAWLAALRHPPPADRPRRPWLARVLRNALLQRERRERTRSVHEERALESRTKSASLPSDVELLERLELARRLAAHVAALEPAYRRVLLLRYFEELAPAEIAAREDAPAATVRTRLRRAKAALRERLDRESGGDGHVWRLALAPLVPAGEAARWTGTGAWIVGTKMAWSAGVAAAGALALVAWWWGSGVAVERVALDPVAEVAPGPPASARAANVPEAERAERAAVAGAGAAARALAVTVVDASGAPLPGAEVWFHRAAFVAQRRSRTQPMVHDPEPDLREHGEQRVCDAGGRTTLPASSEPTEVVARSGDRFGTATVAAGATAAEVVCHEDGTLAIQVVDELGTPVPGFAVALVDDQDWPVVLTRTEGVEAIGRIPHVGSLRQQLDRSRTYSVALHLPCASRESVPVDLDRPPARPVVLVAPPTGRVVVRTVDPAGQALELTGTHVRLTARVPDPMDGIGSVRAHGCRERMSGDEAAFEHVALGLELEVEVEIEPPAPWLRYVELHRGPGRAGETVEVIACVRGASHVTGRAVDASGAPVRAGLHGRFHFLSRASDGPRGRGSTGRFDGDEDGRFALQLPEGIPEGAEVDLRLRDGWDGELGARITFLAPPAGVPVDVGTVTFRELPLLVSGTAVDAHGNALGDVRVEVGENVRRRGGAVTCDPADLPDTRTDAGGRFELRAEVDDGEYAVAGMRRGGPRSPWIPFRPGRRGLRLLVPAPAELSGSIVVTPGFPARTLSVAARAVRSGPERTWEEGAHARVHDSGAFELPPLASGDYELAVLTGPFSAPLHLLGTVTLGSDLPPPALQAVDLRHLRVVDLAASDPEGEPVDRGHVRVRREDDERLYVLADGRLSLVTDGGPVDVEIVAFGFRTATLSGLRESTAVTLQPGYPVRVQLPWDLPPPGPPWMLRVGLMPAGPARWMAEDELYSEDCHRRHHFSYREELQYVAVDVEGEALLHAPAPGEYRLHWELIHPGHPLRGGAALALLNGLDDLLPGKDGLTTIRVADEGETTVVAGPDRERYLRSLGR